MAKRVFTIFLILLTCSIIQSCLGVDYYRIVDVDFKALGDLNENGVTVIDKKIEFIITPKLEYERSAQNSVPSLVSSCYAFTKGTRLENSLLLGTFSLRSGLD